MNTESIDRIIQAFDSSPDNYRRTEVEEALALREEITPRLLARSARAGRWNRWR